MEWLAIILFPLALLAFPVYYLDIPAIKDWYRENHTEVGQKLKAIRESRKEWTALKDKQKAIADDPIMREHYERKAEQRKNNRKEYNSMLYDLERPEREKAAAEYAKIRAEERELASGMARAELEAKEQAYRYATSSDAVLNPTQRFTTEFSFLRAEPFIHARPMQEVPSKFVVNVTGFVNGMMVRGIDLWYVVKMGTKPSGEDYYYYLWAGACTNQSEEGLADFNEYEEDSYTLRSGDGTVLRNITNKVRIQQAYEAISGINHTAIDALTHINAPSFSEKFVANTITSDRLYVGQISTDVLNSS